MLSSEQIICTHSRTTVQTWIALFFHCSTPHDWPWFSRSRETALCTTKTPCSSFRLLSLDPGSTIYWLGVKNLTSQSMEQKDSLGSYSSKTPRSSNYLSNVSGLLWRRANGFQSVLFEWLQTLHAEFSPRGNKQQHACIQTFNRSFSRHEGGGAQQSLGDRFQTLGFGASWCAGSYVGCHAGNLKINSRVTFTKKGMYPGKGIQHLRSSQACLRFFFDLRKQGGKWKGEQTCHQATRRTRALYLQTHSLSTHGTRKPGAMTVTSSNRYHLRQKELLWKRQFSKSCFLPGRCCSFPTPAPTLLQLYSMANSNHLVQWFISVPFRRTAVCLT